MKKRHYDRLLSRWSPFELERDPDSRNLTAGPYRGHAGYSTDTAGEEKKSTHQKGERYIGNKGIAITEDNKRGVIVRDVLYFDA